MIGLKYRHPENKIIYREGWKIFICLATTDVGAVPCLEQDAMDIDLFTACGTCRF